MNLILWIFTLSQVFYPSFSNLIKCPGGKTACPENASCCKDSHGQYSKCCPFPQGVCCQNSFCCPSGAECKEDFCYLKSFQQKIPLRETIESIVILKDKIDEKNKINDFKDQICPDNTTYCPGSDTCCASFFGYGCCPLPQGVCCPDKKTCCPHGMQCFQDDCKPKNSDKAAFSLNKIPLRIGRISSVICPDEETKCPSGQTCCPLRGGGFGCCHFAQAQCCSDGSHCCPHNFKCELKRGMCIPPSDQQPSSPLLQIDGKSECSKGQTMCRTSQGEKCCPLSNAVCCSNGKNCCPSGFTCDESGSCLEDGLSLGTKHYLLGMSEQPPHYCPEVWKKMKICSPRQTCCLHKDGSYACCGFKNAVCCADYLHCCPQGHVCDAKQFKCKSKDGATALLSLLKSPSLNEEQDENPKTEPQEKLKLELKFEKSKEGLGKDILKESQKDTTLRFRNPMNGLVICPNPQYKCPPDTTCCRTKTGDYGCCPYKFAVCCSDKEHCCPQNYKCDLKMLKCIHRETNDVIKMKRIHGKEEEKQVKCQKGETCCKQANGKMAKCPIPNAVCCPDIGCCPSSFKCDKQLCTKLMQFPVAIGKNIPSKPIPFEKDQRDVVLCPGWKQFCPEDSTCCTTEKDQFSCCPLKKAQCCKAGHCCPQNSTCTDIGCSDKQKHNKTERPLHWTPTPLTVPPIIKCPDNKSECPQGDTCCLIRPKVYGCCSGVDAVCCKDKLRCCPKGNVCTNTSCAKPNKNTIDKIAHFPLYEPKALTNTAYFDGAIKLACPNSYTVCRERYCCPYEQGICCENSTFCCPDQTSCDVPNRTCLTKPKEITLPIRKYLNP